MTTTATATPAELEGKSRAELLEMCRARGLAATAWKKERMAQALLSGEEPAARATVGRVKDPSPGALLATQLSARAAQEGRDAAVRRAREERLKRTGPCQSRNGCACEVYEPAGSDAFGWQLCACQHTQWAHAEEKP